jgi:hypothetical protein
MTHADRPIAYFHCDRDTIEQANEYRMNDGQVLAIAHRERCPGAA